MSNAPLSPADVQRLFDYQDGVLLWRGNHGRRGRAGAIAGTQGTYARYVTINGQKLTCARLTWAWHHAAWPAGKVRHLDHDQFNDRIENLISLDDLQAATQARRAEMGGHGNV